MARAPWLFGFLFLALASCFDDGAKSSLGKAAEPELCPDDSLSFLQTRATVGRGELEASAAAPIAQLPFVDGAAGESLLDSASAGDSAGWWFRVGSRSFRAPPHGVGLSQTLSDYCYVRSRHGVPRDLLANRVGGTSSIHVLHAPVASPTRLALEDPQSSHHGHECLSLRQGSVVPVTFPVWPLDPNYTNPLSDFGRSVENEVVDAISGPGVMALLTELAGLPTPNWPTRSAENASASEVVVEYLQREFESFGLQTCLQPVTWRSRCYEGEANGWKEPVLWECAGSNKNVIAYIPGSAPSSGTVTVGAHYDSRPYENMTAPGADDNGSGVASLLAIAKAFAEALKQHGAQPRKSVYFVAFAAEEEGLFGSKAFVSGLRQHEGTALGHVKQQRQAPRRAATHKVAKRDGQRISEIDGDIPGACLPSGSWEENAEHKAIIMDMVGWASPQLTNLTVNLESYDWANSVVEELAQASSDYNGGAMIVTHSGKPFGSDHMSWLSHGFPAALAIHGDDPSYGDVYRYYHSSQDTLANINVPLLGMVTKMNAGGLLRLAGVDPK